MYYLWLRAAVAIDAAVGESFVSGFGGGSAWSMAKEIGDGFVNVTERTFRTMDVPQMAKLGHEIDRLLRELRGGSVTDEPLPEVQIRKRRIQRLSTAMMVMRSHRQKTRR